METEREGRRERTVKGMPLTPPVIALQEHIPPDVRWRPAVPQETRSPQSSQWEHHRTLKVTGVFKAKYFKYLNELVFVQRKNGMSKY